MMMIMLMLTVMMMMMMMMMVVPVGDTVQICLFIIVLDVNGHSPNMFVYYSVGCKQKQSKYVCVL